MENSVVDIEKLERAHRKKRDIFLVFCTCLIVLGTVIFYNAYIVRKTYINQKQTFVETKMTIVAFNKLSDSKSNAVCKYKYGDYEYAFTCYKLSNSDINTKYKIGDSENIRVNPKNPEEVMTKVNIELYSVIIFVVDIVLMVIGTIYSIICVRKSKNFVIHMKKEANLEN